MLEARKTFAAIIEDNGITISIDGVQPVVGYAVGKYAERSWVVEVDIARAETITAFISTNLEWLARDDHYLGAWVHEGRLYLDVSVVYDDRSDAMVAASDAQQMAYYDLLNRQTINVPQYVVAVTRSGSRDHLVRKGKVTTLCGLQSSKRTARSTRDGICRRCSRIFTNASR